MTLNFGVIMPTGLARPEQAIHYLENLNRLLDHAEGHFNSAWLIDHLQASDYAGSGMLEGFTTLTYMAALHPRLQFGHTVVCQSFRNPALVANMGATLQFLSGGRFILGMGAGWYEDEYHAYGYDFPAKGVRVDQLEEALQIIRLLWTEMEASFEGKYYRVNQARSLPKPDPVPPVMIGAFHPRMLRLTARHADSWNVSSTGLEGYKRMSAVLDQACAEIGRDPASIGRSWGGGIACARTREAAEALAGDRFSDKKDDDYGFLGTPREVVDQIRRFVDLGVDTFMFDCVDFPRHDMLDLLIDEVLPAFSPPV